MFCDSLQRSFVTATQTRRKQQMELIHRALQAEEEKKCNERENFHISSVAVNVLSAYEPALFHAVDEHEEGKLRYYIDPLPVFTVLRIYFLLLSLAVLACFLCQ